MTDPRERRPLRSLLGSRKRIREEVDEELQFHLELRAAELERKGLSSSGAREEARRLFGDLEETRAVCYRSDERRERSLERKEHLGEIAQDLSHGLRQLRRRPGFTLAAILTLAVGIGATTAIFSAADHVLLRPLPYADADRVVTLWETEHSTGVVKEVSPGNFLEWQERNSTLEVMGLVEPFGFDLTSDVPPVEVRAWLVSEGYFEALGVEAFLGRNFVPEEYLPSGPAAMMISHRLWRQRYGSDSTVLGRTVEVDLEPVTIVGVLPPGLEYPEPKDMWAPKAWRQSEPGNRTSSYMTAVARLRPGISVARAQADMDRVAAALATEYPRTNGDTGMKLIALEDQVLGEVRPALLVLLGAVGFVLLIACANVASLLLARGAERERELGVRAALGAGRARLVRQLVTESVLLAGIGGAAGLLLARLGVGTFIALSPPELPRVDTISLDGRVLLFASGVTLLTAVLFGLAPALRFSRPDVVTSLRACGRSSTVGRERIRLRSTLVVAETALAVVLLIGAGLLVRSFFDLLDNDVGFASDRRVALQLFLWDRTDGAAQRMQRARDLEEAFESVPGVSEVAIVTSLPFFPSRINAQGQLAIEGRELPPGQENRVFTTVVSPEYFKLMGIALLGGRPFTAEDRSDAPAVAVISESLARRYFAGEDPIGKFVTIGVMSRPARREIVGVVGDVRPTALDSEPQPELFIPFEQSGTGSVTFVVHTAADPASVLPALRERVWQIDPLQTIYYAATVDELISATLVGRRFNLVLLVAFSLIALILAAIGIYGLISFSTSQRIGEIGVRVALGARPTDVVAMIVRQGLGLGIPGIALGMVGALLLTRFMERMLYGVKPTDPLTFVQLALLMLVVSAIAAFIPARRAAARDPLSALREE